ncbi:peptidoglycan DD-metalloendopeptidase family protein [Streptomyces sp. HPF1205]|uniref:peptidoglycan DD-metalloendopeptidase family protein n=1 Tax=Streptomyces sp. HPF1205 TaxID=2873262 RepID=UPI001CECBAD0|nr:peptidoglycan DD-metalloendopeptidase family protein [Streptomyces sp. HPF1205]
MTITVLWFMAVLAVTGATASGTAVGGAAGTGTRAAVTGAAAAPLREVLAVAGVPPGGAVGCAGGRCWPVAGRGPRGRPVVLRGFEPPATPWGAGHRGVDLRAGPGTAVRAAAAGRVAFAGQVGGTPVVVVALPGRLRVTYEPVRATVPLGAVVAAGERVGVVTGAPPRCRASPVPHCGVFHWGLLRDGAYLDPLTLLPPALLRSGPSRLLPVYSAVTG